MLRLRRLDEGSRGVGTAQLQRDRDDLDAEGVELIAQRLPPGQVETTASIRSPGNEHDLLPAQRRQAEFVAVDVGQHQFRCLGTEECTTADTLRAERVQAVGFVVHQRHAESSGDVSDVVPIGKRHAHVCLARTLFVDRPASLGLELVTVDVELFQDHPADGSCGAIRLREADVIDSDRRCEEL